jgi:hypothetical protein
MQADGRVRGEAAERHGMRPGRRVRHAGSLREFATALVAIEVEVVPPDGGRALVVGELDAVPEAAGGKALRIRVCDAHITVLPAR